MPAANPPSKRKKIILAALTSLVGILVIGGVAFAGYTLYRQTQSEKNQLAQQLADTKAELEALKTQDPHKTNEELKVKIRESERVYLSAVAAYEKLLDAKATLKNTTQLDALFANALTLLAKLDYEGATKKIAELNSEITTQTTKVAAATTPVPNAPVSNTPPGSGYSRQNVNSDAGTFTVSIISADLGSTRVIVDTASTSDCSNDCPVLPLATYVSRSGAFAGVNGTYFCPADYPSCAGKTNTFDLLVMNKDKYYFNSGNNVYSNNPAAIFSPGSARFVGAASEWGRDTGVDAVISNYPLLVSGGNVAFGGDDDPKKGSKGSRSFIGTNGSTVYIGVVHNATVAESARVLKAMGLQNALNLDNGGSTALWSGGYKVGPGRNLPNVVLFVRR